MTLSTNAEGIPIREELMNALLTCLHELGGSSHRIELHKMAIEFLLNSKGMRPAVREIPLDRDPSRTKLDHKMGWSLTYLKKMGLVDNLERGVWSLTAAGRKSTVIDPLNLKKMREEQRKAQGRAKAASADEDVVDEESDDAALSWREELLDVLRKMPPDAFERLCQRLLRESSFIEVEVTGRAGDGGIDGHGIMRIGGLISFPVLFQCKRYNSSVGASTVRDFRGAMAGRTDKGLILTTGYFTQEAQKEATRDGATLIDLIDGELLVDKMKELELGVSKKMVEEVTVDRAWFERI